LIRKRAEQYPSGLRADRKSETVDEYEEAGSPENKKTPFTRELSLVALIQAGRTLKVVGDFEKLRRD